MTSIITGDIINSRTNIPESWMTKLKDTLNSLGESPKNWEIFRGDSFQLEVSPEDALKACVLIKSAIKQFKSLDVRLAIGLGDKTYNAKTITESNGSAFINSGECFETIKKHTLALKSDVNAFDLTINIMIELANLTMNSWSVTASTIINTALKNPQLNQKQLAELLGKSQSNISEGLKRGGYDEISKLLHYYNTQVKTL
ncbi:MAG: SatD family protein [Algibacter sp.]